MADRHSRGAIGRQPARGILRAQSLKSAPTEAKRHAEQLARTLKPLLDCIHRELAAAVPARSRVQALTERTAELEWLFQITNNLKGSTDDRQLVEELLIAARRKRLQSAFGVIASPRSACSSSMRAIHGRGAAACSLEEHADPPADLGAAPASSAGGQRRGRDGKKIARCKILSVPVVRDSGRVLGVLAFFNPPRPPTSPAATCSWRAISAGRPAAWSTRNSI